MDTKTPAVGDRVILYATVTELHAGRDGGMAFIRPDRRGDEGPDWPIRADVLIPAGVEYLTIADIAEHFGVPVNTAQTWRIRNGPERSAEAIAKAPTCPQPDLHIGQKRPQAAWREDRLPEWEAWLASRPGQGTGGGRPRTPGGG